MSDEQSPNLEQPHAHPHVPSVTTASGPSELAAPAGSATDPRVGKLTSEDAAMLKQIAESMGALDCMPAWMSAEIEAKTKSSNEKGQR